MAFVRTKKVGDTRYQYLVESYRDKDGKPRQRHKKYLGKAPIQVVDNEKEGASSEQQLEDSCNG